MAVAAVVYDICIVGAGMIGSSAARHATHFTRSVCLIGPEEPKVRQGHDIFGAHYDEGRITRSIASDVIWSTLATRSIARYRQLEKETGIKFYYEVGCLTVGDPNAAFFRSSHETAEKQRLRADLLSVPELRSKFPYLFTADTLHGIFESTDAGYINPRQLCLAQQTGAQNGGCHIIRDIVNSLIPIVNSESHCEPLMKVSTDHGTEILAKKVLVATGAFTNFRHLLPQDLHLNLQPVSQAVIFAELSTEDQNQTKDMPSMLLVTSERPNWFSSKEDSKLLESYDYDCYVLPPIKYFDGKVYLKLGHGYNLEKMLNSPAEIKDWFLSCPPKEIKDGLEDIFKVYFPGLRPISFHTETCVTVNTPTGWPYIDLVTPQLGICLGDNGSSAKCCDELGRLAMEMIYKGTWEDELPQDAFKMIVKSTS